MDIPCKHICRRIALDVVVADDGRAAARWAYDLLPCRACHALVEPGEETFVTDTGFVGACDEAGEVLNGECLRAN